MKLAHAKFLRGGMLVLLPAIALLSLWGISDCAAAFSAAPTPEPVACGFPLAAFSFAPSGSSYGLAYDAPPSLTVHYFGLRF